MASITHAIISLESANSELMLFHDKQYGGEAGKRIEASEEI